ncbi:MAG TPA: ribonuclease HI family protein [Syntrophales bacterium]|nr:ribonuclease HI family protein [Syntrophobacterales bacterium]HRT26720.1 ribonuclease HI family protein [Syntrophales bacterium]HRT71377.1 ribonuclease HI family protein [Syntrophales bacterium]
MADTPFRLYTDGACRGNPGLGGIGVVFKDEQGNIVGTIKGFIGSCTNNEAEYQALIAGLKEAVRRGYSRLSIYMDSELVVKQINGAYRVKSKNLSEYFQEVKDLLSAIGNYRVFHIGRNENKLADQLANEAIDEHEGSL